VQINLDKNDRRLLMWAGLILLPLIVVLALFTQDEEDSGVPSTYSAQSSGAKAAYLFLKEEGYNVERWDETPEELPVEARNTVLVMAAPNGTPSKEQKNALQMYLGRGGRILATGYASSWFLPKTDVIPEPIPEAVWKEYQPEILSPLSRAGTIRMSADAHWGKADLGQLVHYSHEGKGIVVSYKIGEGEVIWWAGNTPLTNAGIRQSGNLALLLNSLGGSKSTRIMWDEYFHAFHDSLFGYFATPPLKYGIVQCVIIFIVLVLTFGRRNAPIRPAIEPSRLSPLEFVQTLGNLYRRADATRTALEVPYKRFRALLVRRLGLRNDVTAAELLESAGKRLGYKDPDFENTLKEIMNGLQDPDIQEAKVLELVQRLNRHARNLKLTTQEE
jgi:Domain of unknown function (DUF4350)